MTIWRGWWRGWALLPAFALLAGCGARDERRLTATTVAACVETACQLDEAQRFGVRRQLRACEAAIAAGCPEPAAE